MRIEELDEFEGTTEDHVRDWLRAKGLVLAKRTWAHPKKPKPYYWDSQLLTEGVLGGLACDFGMSVQSLLREINPRMRPGWPTEEELERHRDGKWICEGEDGELYFGAFREDEESSDVYFFYGDELFSLSPIDARHCRFWPCDAHGNKVSRVPR